MGGIDAVCGKCGEINGFCMQQLAFGSWLCRKHFEEMRIIQAEIGAQAAVVAALAASSTAGSVTTRLLEETTRLEEMQDRRLFYLKLAGLEGI
jgi:hypothetical protein